VGIPVLRPPVVELFELVLAFTGGLQQGEVRLASRTTDQMCELNQLPEGSGEVESCSQISGQDIEALLGVSVTLSGVSDRSICVWNRKLNLQSEDQSAVVLGMIPPDDSVMATWEAFSGRLSSLGADCTIGGQDFRACASDEGSGVTSLAGWVRPSVTFGVEVHAGTAPPATIATHERRLGVALKLAAAFVDRRLAGG
jgi:hypothetical protein